MIGEPCEKPKGFDEGCWRLLLEYHILRTAKASKEEIDILGLHLIFSDCRRMTKEEAAKYEKPIGVLRQYVQHNIAVGGDITFFGESEPTIIYWGEVKYPQEMRLAARRGSDWYWCREARCLTIAPRERFWGKKPPRHVEVRFFESKADCDELGMINVIKEQKPLSSEGGEVHNDPA